MPVEHAGVLDAISDLGERRRAVAAYDTDAWPDKQLAANLRPLEHGEQNCAVACDVELERILDRTGFEEDVDLAAAGQTHLEGFIGSKPILKEDRVSTCNHCSGFERDLVLHAPAGDGSGHPAVFG